MTTTQTRPGTRPLLGPPLAAATATTVLLRAGLYFDTPWKKQGNKEWAVTTHRYGLGELLISLAFVAVSLAVVFGVVVSRGLRAGAEAKTRQSLALAVAGALSAVVFWTVARPRLDFGDDVVGGGFPDEWYWVLVPVLGPGGEVGDAVNTPRRRRRSVSP